MTSAMIFDYMTSQ